MNEIWKDIPNYEGIYEASNTGFIRTKDGKTTHTDWHGVRKWKSRILKPRGINTQTGYRVSLWKDKKSKDWLVCRLVALTFLGEPPERLTVNHKDGNRFNNNIDNLEWMTLKENIKHAFETLLCPQHHIKLTSADGVVKLYRSKAQASVDIGRKSSYISNRMKKGDIATGIDGVKYTIEQLSDKEFINAKNNIKEE